MGRTFLKTTAVLAVLGLGLGVAACGDDDEAASTTTEAEGATADPAAYCDGLVEFNSKVFDVDLDDDASEDEVKQVGAELAPLFQDLADNAPEKLSADVDDLNDTAIQPLLDGKGEAFNSDETFAAYTKLVDASVGECDFDEVAVDAVDYAFQGVPTTLKAGTFALQLTNKSEGGEQHEMVVFRKADGETRSILELLDLPDDEAETATVFRGAAQAEPGEEGTTLSSLDPGDYAMVCFIPVGGGEDGPPHFTRGMVAEFTVE